MKSVQKIDLGLTGYDELFMNDAERKENKLPRIYDIPLSEIDDFPDHPFKVKLDEDMDQLVQSIKERGIDAGTVETHAIVVVRITNMNIRNLDDMVGSMKQLNDAHNMKPPLSL